MHIFFFKTKKKVSFEEITQTDVPAHHKGLISMFITKLIYHIHRWRKKSNSFSNTSKVKKSSTVKTEEREGTLLKGKERTAVTRWVMQKRKSDKLYRKRKKCISTKHTRKTARHVTKTACRTYICSFWFKSMTAQRLTQLTKRFKWKWVTKQPDLCWDGSNFMPNS